MHESYVARSILDKSLAALPKDKHKISQINLGVGVMEGLEPDSLRLYFNELAKGSAAEGANLVIELLPAQLHCSECHHVSSYDGKQPLQVTCPKCQGLNRLVGGRELFLKSLEAQ
ncbi:hypothetical protein A2311_02070 [candidate division WOR-1 bacterium RIFOXYB2_FULL_48_7]|uniref:Hydrogenase maturation factor HypA n=1 Tax=candidate division WOR-1 bacterium RIFOXYB2_FULL_48_7 TaxID=1802583 RepID=A0A1F4TVW1_UNCSA|nr:MAG: hypothetical protein A2311_02070 [candidate division WOR-1 bacterium RIFOXYB2_FULL_48_7]